MFVIKKLIELFFSKKYMLRVSLLLAYVAEILSQ